MAREIAWVVRSAQDLLRAATTRESTQPERVPLYRGETPTASRTHRLSSTVSGRVQQGKRLRWRLADRRFRIFASLRFASRLFRNKPERRFLENETSLVLDLFPLATPAGASPAKTSLRTAMRKWTTNTNSATQKSRRPRAPTKPSRQVSGSGTAARTDLAERSFPPPVTDPHQLTRRKAAPFRKRACSAVW